MKKFFAITLSCVPIVASVAPLLSLSSCDEPDLKISLDRDKLICYEHDFTLNYKANRSIPKDTRLGIIGAGSDLFIDEERTDFTKESGTLAFKINSGIHYDKQIDFNLVFSYGDKEILIEGLQVLYVFQEEEQKDEIKPTQKIITNQDDWEYTYRFQFSNAPLSSVKINLNERHSRGLLELLEDEIKVVKEDGLYYLDVPMHLSYGVVENDFVTFDINFSFTNSFGFTQVTTVSDLGCEFKFTPTDTIPQVFLDLRNQGGIVDLYGLKSNVPVSAINHFSVLSIPYVKSIHEGSFGLIDGNPDTYKSISKIKLAPGIIEIKPKVFFNFNNLEELDLSEIDSTPTWMHVPLLFNFKLFNSEAWRHKSGIIWIGVNFSDRETTDETRKNWVINFEKLGLGATGDYTSSEDKWEHSWTPYGIDEVTPSDWFITKKENDVVTLTAIDKSKATKEKLRNIGVIKIPDEVTSISLNPTSKQSDFSIFNDVGCCFNALNFHEYEVFEIVGNMYNRRLILGKNLTEINQNIDGKGAFYKAGICGEIIVPNQLAFIENNTFEEATYRFVKYDIIEQLCDFRLGFTYGTNPSLKKIGNRAFANSFIEYCAIPSSINQLGDSLFTQCNELANIDFSNFEETPSKTEIDASTPLSNLESGSNKYFYINKESSSTYDWTVLITDWCGGTIPEGWSIIKK